MPIGIASTTVDINPVPIRLSANDVNIAIQNMPDENKLKPTATVIYRPNTVPSRGIRPQQSWSDEEIMEPVPTNEDTNQKRSTKSKSLQIKEDETIKESYI